jgi:hypothetical protein
MRMGLVKVGVLLIGVATPSADTATVGLIVLPVRGSPIFFRDPVVKSVCVVNHIYLLLLLLLLSNIYYKRILGFCLLHFPWKSVECDSVFQILMFCCSRGHNCSGKLVELVASKIVV